jgi:hypothetical protein
MPRGLGCDASATETLRADRRLRDPHGIGAPVVDDHQPRRGRAGRAAGTGVDRDGEDAALERPHAVILALDHEFRADAGNLKHEGGDPSVPPGPRRPQEAA